LVSLEFFIDIFLPAAL